MAVGILGGGTRRGAFGTSGRGDGFDGAGSAVHEGVFRTTGGGGFVMPFVIVVDSFAAFESFNRLVVVGDVVLICFPRRFREGSRGLCNDAFV